MIGKTDSEIESIKAELEKNAVNLKESNFIFFDISSTCVGYTVVSLNFENKTADFQSAGAIWLPDLSHGKKYNYMRNAITTYFDIVHKIDYVVYEMYSVNPNKGVGMMVVPEMVGSIKEALAEIGVECSGILPQSWRAILKIKATSTQKSDGKTERDFKSPTREKVLEYLTVPEQVVSNVTNNTRKTPSDLYDSLAISIAWLNKMGFKKLTFNNIKFQEHVGALHI